MKTILFTTALPSELKIVKTKIKEIKLKGVKVKFLLTGVGNYNTIFSLKDYIDKKCKPDFIVNLGVCGTNCLEDDFFQVYRVKNLSNLKEFIIPIYFSFLELKSILSSDTVITDGKDLIGENYVDMESYANCLVADKEKIPLIIIKKPFDIVSKLSKSVDIKSLQASLENFNYELLINKVLTFLEENSLSSYDTSLDYYKNYFKFTFAETEIFKKNYNKFISFGEDFENFFKKNKQLTKKQFLKKMSELK